MADISSGFASKIMNGAIAGTIGVTSTFPLDLAKTRLQNQHNGSKRIYKNLVDCLAKVCRIEGVKGCYRGLLVNVLLVNPEKAIKLAVNDQARQIMGGKSKTLPLHCEMLAGAVAGLCQVIITTPMEMLKIQMQVSGKTAVKSIVPNTVKPLLTAKLHTAAKKSNVFTTRANISALSLTRDLLQTKGITGIYRGLGATLLRDIPFSCLHFTIYSHLNFLGYGPNGEKSSTLHSCASGLASALISALAVTPCDVIKTRLQVLPSGYSEPRYLGIRDCATQIYKHEGLGSFFKGAVPRIMVIAPLFGIAQAVYNFEVSQRLIEVYKSY
ncbi:mitochondrial glutamate carrier 1-like isoform X2 [Dendronephthya gigantea]|uniref:mitochondrial glutamate carrier 1-like isoform X2 n=1 Tax=Dendronephthya gigantea TaxID=151771 RepID=UPI0010693A64|nr:mitochondrial glutamate carrier 1-like isoform X2 [Dendronephthya gigantea]